MMNPKIDPKMRVFGVAVLAGIALGLSGCGSSEEPVVQAPAPRSSTPRLPAEKVVMTSPVATLMSEMDIDGRIKLPEELAPVGNPSREAILSFFDAFARGDDMAISGLMETKDQNELNFMVDSGIWEETTEGITEILLEAGTSPSGLNCVLAIFEIGDTYQPQLWYYSDDDSDEMIFEAVSAPPDIMNQLYGLDPIAVWFEILDEEQRLAEIPDEIVLARQVRLADAPSRGGGGAPGGDGQPGRMNPGTPNPVAPPSRGIPGPSPGGG